MGAPDMRVPISHCLGFPDRLAAPTPRLDLAAIGCLTFERPDYERFPSLRLALDALAAGAGLPTVLNAANEIAVEAFLAGRIAFGGIARHVAAAIDAALGDGSAKEPATVAEALGIDHLVRERSRAILAER
jgi:1-deoxy-D-xylulose-5-phosphate reductoisomerase